MVDCSSAWALAMDRIVELVSASRLACRRVGCILLEDGGAESEVNLRVRAVSFVSEDPGVDPHQYIDRVAQASGCFCRVHAGFEHHRRCGVAEVVGGGP